MTQIATCPDAADYRRLLIHSLAYEREPLLAHLETCPDCWGTVGPILEMDHLLHGLDLASDPHDQLVDSIAAMVKDEPAPRESGSRLGHYEIRALIGRGGMGEVYHAVDVRIDRPVALKVMRRFSAGHDGAHGRFLREARAAAQVTHDNVVTVYEADECDGVPFIAMPLLGGQSLESALRAGRLFTIAEIESIAAQTAAGLAAAHALGVVHRDIKPGNLWLEPGGRLKILDFGLAKPVAASPAITQDGAILGTPAFMAPEQARGLAVDARSDLFSLGAVLYRLTTGRLPFDGPNTMAVLMALGSETPPPARSLNPSVPAALSALIQALLAKSPMQRPQNAEAVVQQFTSGTRRTRPRTTPGFTAGLAILMLLVVAGVIIIIRDKDGNETKIEVPDGASVTVRNDAGQTLAVVVNARNVEWERKVAAMTGKAQVEAVNARLKELNPKFDPLTNTYGIVDGKVVALSMLQAAEVTELAPVHALSHLKRFFIQGNSRNPTSIVSLKGLKLEQFASNGCPLKDVSPLEGMPLTVCNLWGAMTSDLTALKGMKLKEVNVGHSTVSNIAVLKGMPLEQVCLNYTEVADLTPLVGAPIRNLFADSTKITDLKPLEKMPIEWLAIRNNEIKDYSPLKTLPKLTRLELDYDPKRHAELLKSIPTLKRINDKPAAEVLGK